MLWTRAEVELCLKAAECASNARGLTWRLREICNETITMETDQLCDCGVSSVHVRMTKVCSTQFTMYVKAHGIPVHHISINLDDDEAFSESDDATSVECTDSGAEKLRTL
jgi:hypothetical protein